MKAIYNYIQNSFAHIPLDLSTCGYRIRPFEDIVQSAYGTDSELIYVFQQLLKEAGLKADICAVFPDTDATGIGLKPTTLYISTKVNGKKRLLAPTAKATQTICFLRQYCPALNLSTGIMEEARFQPSPITYKADLTLTDMGASVKAEAAIAPFVEAAKVTRKLGMGLNAGHDLSLENLAYFHENIPWVDEVSIGHALICDALYLGLKKTIEEYKNCLR